MALPFTSRVAGLVWAVGCVAPRGGVEGAAVAFDVARGACLPSTCTPSGLVGGHKLQRDDIDCIADDGHFGDITAGHGSFEWFDTDPGVFVDLLRGLDLHCDPGRAQVLQVGCGNSELAERLYDAGFTGITNVDIREVAIRQMSARNADRRPLMRWLCLNARTMSRHPEITEYDLVLDRGTLDHFVAAGAEHRTYFDEVAKVIHARKGLYICVSNGLVTRRLLQGHGVGSRLGPLRLAAVLELPSPTRSSPYLGYVFQHAEELRPVALPGVRFRNGSWGA